jgi:hypothetical protein
MLRVSSLLLMNTRKTVSVASWPTQDLICAGLSYRLACAPFALLLVFCLSHAALCLGQANASLTVTVRDIHGVAVTGARVEVVSTAGAIAASGNADPEGAITFKALAPAAYKVEVAAPGLRPYTSPEIMLSTGEKHELPVVAMGTPTTQTTVNVVAAPEQVAQAQVNEEMKQRAFGILPNYSVSYIWNAAPMKPELKFKLAYKAFTDPVTFLIVGAVAGVEQSHKTFPGYGQGLEGYAKRYGSTYADTVTGAVLGHALLPVIFHQDPRYFYQGSGTTRSRIMHAIGSTFVSRRDNGRPMPNYSEVLGSFAAAGISNLYRSPGDRNAGLTVRNGFIVLGSNMFTNLMREFLSRKVTPNVPGFANGKP